MAGFLNYIQIETSTTSGTLTSAQLATLQESKSNYIMYGAEVFRLQDNDTTNNTLVYINVNDNSGSLKVKAITVTISTLAWEVSELSSGGGTKKYQHTIQCYATRNSYRASAIFSFISTDSTAYTTVSQVSNAIIANVGQGKVIPCSVLNASNSTNLITNGFVYANPNTISFNGNKIALTTVAIDGVNVITGMKMQNESFDLTSFTSDDVVEL